MVRMTSRRQKRDFWQLFCCFEAVCLILVGLSAWRTVRSEKRSYLDECLRSRRHVNNCQYIRMAADFLPEDFAVHQLRVEYKRQAVLGNVMIPEVYMEANKATVVLNAEDQEPYAVVEFTK